MRLVVPSLLALCAPAFLLSACSAEKSEEVAAAAPTGQSAAGQSGPAINAAVAPGVAFTFSYAFSLPAKAIPGVQQEHAAACQQLGPSRCRITGLNYEQPGEDSASGRMDFLLAPDIGHAFANQGIDAVKKAAGTLENAVVNGENAGDAIRLSQQDSAAVQAEIARIDQRLQAKGLTADERAELQRQAGTQREQLREQVADRRAREQSIATTPVTFTYASEGMIGGDNIFGGAVSASWSSAKTALSFASLVAGVALPWLLLAGLGILAWRGIRARRPVIAHAENAQEGSSLSQ